MSLKDLAGGHPLPRGNFFLLVTTWSLQRVRHSLPYDSADLATPEDPDKVPTVRVPSSFTFLVPWRDTSKGCPSRAQDLLAAIGFIGLFKLRVHHVVAAATRLTTGISTGARGIAIARCLGLLRALIHQLTQAEGRLL